MATQYLENEKKVDRDITRKLRHSKQTKLYKALLVGYDGNTFDACKLFKALTESNSKYNTKIYQHRIMLISGYIQQIIIKRFGLSGEFKYVSSDLIELISKFYNGLTCCNQNVDGLPIKEGIFDMKPHHKHLFHIVHVNNKSLSNKHVISQFSDVFMSIMFCCSLTNYCQIDENGINMLKQSIILFGKICNNSMLKNTKSIFLYLTDKSKFEAMLQQTPLSVCFADYEGGNNYDECIGFIEHKFKCMVECTFIYDWNYFPHIINDPSSIAEIRKNTASGFRETIMNESLVPRELV